MMKGATNILHRGELIGVPWAGMWALDTATDSLYEGIYQGEKLDHDSNG